MFGLLFQTRGAADVERAHRELCAGFADRLGCDNANGFAYLDRVSCRKVAAIAFDTNAASRFTCQRRPDTHFLQARKLNRRTEVFIDLDVCLDDNSVIDRVDNVVERRAADDAVTERFDLFTVPDDRLSPNAAHRSAVLFGDDHVLSNVNQTACEIT